MVSVFTSHYLILMALNLVLVFILLLGSSLMLESATDGERIVENDRVALLEFKKQITSDPHGALSSWNNTIPFCNWVGITCGHRHRQRVIHLALRGKSLGGKISQTIGNLTFLRVIDIGNNSFHGKIPKEIGNLIQLRYISLENNTLEGELPASLANCTHLRRIFFSNNNFVGKIPVQLVTSWSKLDIISMNGNGLIGELPDSLGNISSIRVISLGRNELQGSIPESFCHLTNLLFLQLHQNKLSGTFPVSLYNLSSLVQISLAVNQIHGSLPREIGLSLPNLQLLAISSNFFSGRIPDSISNISTLNTFDLSFNSFIGPITNNLGNLQNLQFFAIDSNQCAMEEGDDLHFVNSLLNCTQLELLALGNNGFKDPFPNFKANISTQLSMLYLEGNQLSGTIPVGIENLINLSLLSMEGNFLEGIIPSFIGKLSKLQSLILNANRLSGQIPSTIGNLTLLYELYLEDNNLNGSIPSNIGNCRKLQDLTLYNNSFEGPIPKQLFLIPSLTISLDLSYNSFSGSLPLEIGRLKSLSVLNISNNKLSGEIPSSIGDCNSLEYLSLRNNLFDGVIPQSIILLKGLQDLDLSLNNLSGQIPKGLEKLLALRILNISFNNLEGEVPTKGIFGNASEISVEGNNNLCGGIAELQLPTCLNHGSAKREKSNTLRTVLVITSVILGSILISCFLTLYWKRKSKGKHPSIPLINNRFLRLSYKELFQATEGFSSTKLIGCGSFGSVYKGIINQDETIVAIKVLNLENPRNCKSFMAECEALRNIRHRNLVKIITTCSSLDSNGKDFKALVYEFMSNGSLDDWLHPPVERHNHSRNLSLLQRLNIAIDVASALDYLHYDCHVSIVHCDLKPSNVLLDSDMIAHVSDFGLAKLLLEPRDGSFETQNSTVRLRGSIGYTAPEYGIGGRATTQGDVFSYGILLLEMFTGKRPTHQMFSGDLNLHNFARAALPADVMQILDPTLLLNEEQGEEIEELAIKIDKLQNCATLIIEVALQCSTESPRERVNMKDVMRRLHLIKGRFC